MFDVNDIFLSEEKSLLLLKYAGLLLIIGATLYLIFNKKLTKNSTLTWKKVVGLSVGMGAVNAGIVIIFGKATFFTTPLILFILVVLWLLRKIPRPWQGKHILAFGSIFSISSISIFFGVAFIFFHLAIEGKV